jgi:hypothetical protein
MGGEQERQGLVLPRLDCGDPKVTLFRQIAHTVQQDGLADTAKPHGNEAPLEATGLDAIQRDRGMAQQFAATG